MDNTKIVKAYCRKSDKHYGLILKEFSGTYKVVDVIDMSEAESRITRSEVTQKEFYTNDNLLACYDCQSRKVGGCSHPKSRCECNKKMGYNFMCVYCKDLVLDYYTPTSRDIEQYKKGGKIKLAQGKEVKIVNFANVKWIKFDNIQKHEIAPEHYHEPKGHVILKKEDIEFHGYNVSQMDEGVYYEIGKHDDFDMECFVDTSTISPHPGGHLYIDFGIIKANIDQNGGTFFLGKKQVCSVKSRFKMRLSLIEEGKYQIYIDDKLKGEEFVQSRDKIKVIFGFTHESHYCELLSHAYLTGIKMVQGMDQ